MRLAQHFKTTLFEFFSTPYRLLFSPIKKAILIMLGLIIGSFSSLEGSLSREASTLIDDLNQAAFLEFYLIKKGNNPLISPFSIQASFLMAYMGAKGQTAQQMAQVLNFTLPKKELASAYSSLYSYLYSPKKDKDSYQLMIGNGMWIEETFKILPSYKKLVTTEFKGEVQSVDFTNPVNAVNTINGWVSTETDGKIKNFLSSNDISNTTRLLLTNGMILKGTWKYPFETKLSGDKPFLISKNVSRNVPTMHQTSVLPYFEDKNSQILALPLQATKDQAEVALIIFLPKQPKLNDLFDFYYSEQQSNPESFLSFTDKFEAKKVDLFLPKFAFNKRSFLKSFFISIGMHDPFSTAADFSGITGSQDLFISNAFHQSFISVAEGGIFAAAASGISFDIKSAISEEPPVPFIANHPFFYCIADLKTKLILYMGVLNDPSASYQWEPVK